MAAAPPPDLVSRFRSDLEAVAGPDPGPLAVAVSGGPDSLALLLLAHAAFPGRVEAATVDHGLRAGERGRGGGGRPALRRARSPAPYPPRPGRSGRRRPPGGGARRPLLGAGRLDGRAGPRPPPHRPSLRRPGGDPADAPQPRLGRGRARRGEGARAPCRAAAAGFGCAGRCSAGGAPSSGRSSRPPASRPARDPSNEDERFDRARLRRRLAEAPWLDPAALARSAALLAEAEAALEWTAGPLFAARTELADGAVTLRPNGLPGELLRRLVLRCLRQVAPGAQPRGEALAGFIARLEQGGTATLCEVKGTGGETWRFEPAPPRRKPSSRA